ncbi:Asp23/Gls24 family envelope stress response protein [Tumebacillus sp. DT12]|uniref:Asp23/Gls24 family envelope stress response protein n=1 Tax=Tumebacillus lacus TaxID=2995335 RepID=A0ABT3X6C2_9BACL|nr:Asp23/Gls24 family envelope stress response protein [Tumebacillus lacus]MCX7571508.1 Asp23/Gls24 family envelope stress response protein [Tumebacillus lacus]
MTTNTEFDSTDIGNIRIANEVIEIIAGLAATEVKGVAGMSGGVAGGIAELLGRKNLSKGVKVEVGQRQCAVDLTIVAEYGVRIPEVCSEIQENVKRAIESMTGLEVVEVNISVLGVTFKSAAAEETITVKEEEKPQAPNRVL